jgi:hypothetical protein
MRTLLLVGLLSSTLLAGTKVSVAIAPAITRDAVPSQLEAPMAKALAEMLSWELSMLPNVKVTDPQDAAKALGTSERSSLSESDLTDVEAAGRRLGVDAFALPYVRRDGDEVTVAAAISVKVGTRPCTFKWETHGPQDRILPMVRQAALQMADSLHMTVSSSARALLQQSAGSSWEIVVLFAKGIDAEDAGRKTDALALYREAQSRGAVLPALLVRMRKLEATVGR